MSSTEVLPLSIRAVPLTPDAFAPFGDVATRPGAERRRYLPTAEGRADDATQFSLWISNAATLRPLPVRLVGLERHPFSAQTFVPLSAGRYLVAACHADAKGAPILSTLRAFIAQANQAVTYARNVWHHPSTVLDQPMEFAVSMAMTGRKDDDVFLDLDIPITVEGPAL